VGELPYLSALLFHGPGAREGALAEEPNIGRRVAPPIGEAGIKIDDARRLIDLMDTAPVGDRPGVLTFGPVDKAAQSATDVLLKVIEEFDPQGVRPLLWAYDLGSVSNTIRSRCLHRWCPYAEENPTPDTTTAEAVLNDVLRGDRAGVIGIIHRYLKAADDAKEATPRLLECLALVLADQPDELYGTRYDLWQSVRRLSGFKHVSKLELTAGLVGVINE